MPGTLTDPTTGARRDPSPVVAKRLSAADLGEHLDNCSDVVELAGASTNQAYRATARTASGPRAVVVRVHDPDVDPAALTNTAHWALLLAEHGAPVPRPVHMRGTGLAAPRSLPGGSHALAWEALPGTSPTGHESPAVWEALGAATRAFHAAADQILLQRADAPALGHHLDMVSLRCRVTEARAHLTDQEHDALLGLLEHTEASLAFLDGGVRGSYGVVHDDLWPKNFLVTTTGDAWLVDLDNLHLGPRRHDLGFIVRAHARGDLPTRTRDAFADGYGADLPDLDEARVLAGPHQIRWLAQLAGRRTWTPEHERLLTTALRAAHLAPSCA